MGKLKWVTNSVSCLCQDPTKLTQCVSFPSAFSCYPFSLTRFGATEIRLETSSSCSWVNKHLLRASSYWHTHETQRGAVSSNSRFQTVRLVSGKNNTPFVQALAMQPSGNKLYLASILALCKPSFSPEECGFHRHRYVISIPPSQ